VDWNKLLPEVKDAAINFGYTEETWEGDGEIEVEDKDWDELTDSEKAAALVLGYTEDTWED
jgi:hypothetical protein